MGICETLSNDKYDDKNHKYKVSNKKKKKGSNLFSAPIDSSPNNDNIYVNNSLSQMTMDNSYYNNYKKPNVYKYINKYKTNGFQKSIVKASLEELGGQGNSLMNSNKKNSIVNQNSIYSSKYDDTGYESSYEGFEEMIIDGKMNEDLVKKSEDKNTLNNYNEFIKKKGENNDIKKNLILDYYNKSSSSGDKKVDEIKKNNEENKESDELSGIPLGSIKPLKNNNKGNMQKYLLSMGKY